MDFSDWLPDECTIWKTNPMYWQLVAALKVAKGKYGITDRASCIEAGHKVADSIGMGQIVTNSLAKCACKAVYEGSKPPPPQWHDWASIGGQIKGTVGAAIDPGGSTDLYVQGVDDGLWQKYYANGKWSEWTLIDNKFKMASSPTVVAYKNYRGVYARGVNGQVYLKRWDGQWHDWASIGGQTKDAIGATITPDGATDLYIRGMDDTLWQKYYAGGKWSDWMHIDNKFKMASAPTVVSYNNYRGVYARGGDGQVYLKRWDGQWHDWAVVGGQIKDAVGAAMTPEGITDIYVKGSDDRLWQKYYDGKWSDWFAIDPSFRMASSPTVVAYNNYRGVYARGEDGQVYLKYWG